MADNTAQTGTDTISTDDVTTLNGGASSGIKVQRVKACYGDDNTARDVSMLFPLPVVDPDITASGTLTAAAQTVVLALNGDSSAAVQITGTWVGTISFEATVDGTTWMAVNAVAAGTTTPVQNTTVNGLFRLTPGGLASIRANMTAFTSGSAVVSVRASAGPGGTFVNQVIPTLNIEGRAANQSVTTTSAASAAATLTLPAAGAGLSHYITSLEVSIYSAAARTGGATPIVVTTTNLPGALAITIGTAAAIGVIDRYFPGSAVPIKSSAANTATTIVAPIVTGGIWRITATYFNAA